MPLSPSAPFPTLHIISNSVYPVLCYPLPFKSSSEKKHLINLLKPAYKWLLMAVFCVIFLGSWHFNSEVINQPTSNIEEKPLIIKFQDLVRLPALCTTVKKWEQPKCPSNDEWIETSLAVQWLRHWPPMQGAQVWALVEELRSQMPWGCGQN